MKILHIDSGREMRGGQWQVLLLMEALAQAGHDCVLLAPAGSPLQVEVGRRGLDARDLSITAVSRNAAGMDLIHAHDARAHTLALTVCRLPVVVSRRVAFPIGRGVASRWKYSRASRFIAISRFVKECVKEAGVPDDRISVVFDGVPVPAETASGDLVVAPATDDPQKGAALAREAGRVAGVEMLFSKDLAADLPSARLFLYLSEQEGLGSGALLAAAHGVPVIASNVGGLPEAVEHGSTGLLTENRADEVASCMRRLLDDAASAREMGLRGRARVLRRFTVPAMAQGTTAVYQRLLNA